MRIVLGLNARGTRFLNSGHFRAVTPRPSSLRAGAYHHQDSPEFKAAEGFEPQCGGAAATGTLATAP